VAQIFSLGHKKPMRRTDPVTEIWKRYDRLLGALALAAATTLATPLALRMLPRDLVTAVAGSTVLACAALQGSVYLPAILSLPSLAENPGADDDDIKLDPIVATCAAAVGALLLLRLPVGTAFKLGWTLRTSDVQAGYAGGVMLGAACAAFAMRRHVKAAAACCGEAHSDSRACVDCVWKTSMDAREFLLAFIVPCTIGMAIASGLWGTAPAIAPARCVRRYVKRPTRHKKNTGGKQKSKAHHSKR
jgi:hypothetical protein